MFLKHVSRLSFCLVFFVQHFQACGRKNLDFSKSFSLSNRFVRKHLLQCSYGGASAPRPPLDSGAKGLIRYVNRLRDCLEMHTRGEVFGVPCVTYWFPSGMRSSMQPAHF